MKSDKPVIVLLIMLSLTEALLDDTPTYFQRRKILRLQSSNKFEVKGIIETTETGEKGNRTCIKPKVIWKESCFLAKSDLAKRDNCQIIDFHYRVDGEYYNYEYSNASFTFINSSKDEINCQVSVEVDGKHLSVLRSAVDSRNKFLNGGGHRYSGTRTALAVTRFKDNLFQDSKDFERHKISRKQRVSDSGKRTSGELRRSRYKRQITVLGKSSKDRNRIAMRRHDEKMKTISASDFRMRVDRRMAANVRNLNEDGPLGIISHLRRKAPKEVVDISRRRNLQIQPVRTQVRVSVLRDSYSRRDKISNESKDTSHRSVSPVINGVRNENKEISQKRVFQLKSQVKVEDNLKKRIFQSNTEIRGDSHKKMLLLSNKARQVVGEVSQRRLFKSGKEARVSRDRNIYKVRNKVINEIKDIRQKDIGQVGNEARKIVGGRFQGILQSKNEFRNTISSAMTSNVKTKKGVNRRLGTTHFNEARSMKRNVDSNYFRPEEDLRNSAHLTGRNARRLFSTRDLRKLIRNRSGNPFIPRSAIKSRMLGRAHISRVGMRKIRSTGMFFDNRYFVKRKSFVYLRYQTVRELARNKKIIKFENLVNRGNMINKSKERRNRKNITRECRHSESLISPRQFSSMLNFSGLLSNTEFRNNVAKIILNTNCTSERFSKISEQETYLDNNSTFANSLSTLTQRHINIVAPSAGKFGKRTPTSIVCCRFIKKFENEVGRLFKILLF